MLKRVTKRALVTLLSLSMIFGGTNITAEAQSNISNVAGAGTETVSTGDVVQSSGVWDGVTKESDFEGNGFRVTYKLQDFWDGGYNANVIIENTSDKVIENWTLEFDYQGGIANVWNAVVETSEQGKYVVKNVGWNQDIAVGQSVEFGINGEGDFAGFPNEYQILGQISNVNTEDFSIVYEVTSNWEMGYCANIIITNNTEEELIDWVLEFDYNGKIEEIWNGVIEKHEGDHYIVKNAEYNYRILPAQSVSIGLIGHPENPDTVSFSNVKMLSYGLKKSEIVEGRIKIDTSMFLLDDENGIYYIPKDVYSITGTVENSDEVEKITYSSNNTFGLDLISGEIAIGNEWVINNIPLILGYNELTVTAFYRNNTISSDTVVIACIYEDRMEGLGIPVCDSDSDGLEDYIEAIYGTDPLVKDTDGDGLSDYTELAVMGTNPLNKDSDDNGILDGDEDYDEDGLSNREEEERGTLLYGRDSDYDELSDYDEVYVYFTNPLLKDTDEDGASDGFEIEKGYNPLQTDTFFTVEKTIEAGGTIYELRLTATGENIESLEVNPVNNSKAKYGLIAGYIDPAIDFNIDGNFEKADLKIYFDESYLEIDGFEPALYYIDEENHEMVEMSGEWDGVSNYFYVSVPHFSTYITLNKTEFKKVWDNAIKAQAFSENGVSNLNIVFVTDLSGSMWGSKLSTMKSAINEFINVLSPADQVALVSFTSSANTLSGLTNDKNTVMRKVNSMSANGLTAIYKGIDRAVTILEDSNHSGYDMIIVFTDGYDEPSTTYDGKYRPIINRAKEAGIVVHTIGIGTIDGVLLTKIANETGGSFYYAESASDLRDQVNQVQDEIIDYTKDSNNDGISDYFTKCLCDCKLITWKGEPVVITASYEEIQKDLDGDFDNDGIKNGDELKFFTNEDKVVNIVKYSDMEEADTDFDSLTDGQEKNLGTNKNVKDISDADYNRIVNNNDLYISSLVSDDYVDGWWLKFQLATGNAILRYKLSYVEDYKRALIEFINVYNQTTIEDTALQKISEFYEADYVETTCAYVEMISSIADETADLSQTGAELKEAYRQLNKARKNIARMDQWVKFKDINQRYVTERMKFNKYFGEVQDLEASVNKIPIPEFLVEMSPKTRSALKNVGSGIPVGLYIMDTADNIYNSCVAYGSLNAEFERYELIMEYLNYVKENSEIEELKEAAEQVGDAIDSQKKRDEQMAVSIIFNIKDTGVSAGIDIIVKEFGPMAWAAQFGVSLGNLLAGTATLDEETLKVIALGNSAKTYAGFIDKDMVRDTSSYYKVDCETMEKLQLLAQLRVVGEDKVARGNDKSGIVLKLVNRIFVGSKADFESDLSDKINSLEKIGNKLGFNVTGKFPNAYLNK